MRRAFYALPTHAQNHFRRSVAITRDGQATPDIDRAWDAVGIGADTIARTHVLDLFDIYCERLWLLPRDEQDPVVIALFGGPNLCR